MTPQEAFNKVVIGLRAQGEPSTDGALCLYRGPGELKCAIGMLIPDEEYYEALDNNLSIRDVVSQVRALDGLDISFLSELQTAHDVASDSFELDGFMPELEEAFHQIAYKYHLTLPPKA